MQPKLRSKVQCADREVGEITRIIADPISHDVSHIVVGGVMASERQVPMGKVQVLTDHLVQIKSTAQEFEQLPAFERDKFVTIHEVEIAHLEDRLHVVGGEVLVPLPTLERDVKRRTFFANFTHVIGALIALPMALPVLKYLMKPMYNAFDNDWIKVGGTGKIKTDDLGVQYKFKRKIKEAYMPEAQIDKNVWVLKATPATLEKIYGGKDLDFRDPLGKHIWTNKKDVPYIAFSGKCPHLGCGYKWRAHKVLGQVFLCPCHLSIYDAGGKVLDGPAPRSLDVLPIRVSASGEVEVIDMEFKAGTKSQIRIL
jgi:Rieske Fe-S protein